MKVLTINEVAKILGINIHTAYRYAREGKIPSVRIGRSWRVVQETFEVWIKGKMSKNIEEELYGGLEKNLKPEDDPFRKVMGIFTGGPILSSPEDIDEELYSDKRIE